MTLVIGWYKFKTLINKYKIDLSNTFFLADKSKRLFYKKMHITNVYFLDNIEDFNEYKKGFEYFNMKFDKIIMNPPYSIGNEIWMESHKYSKDIVCLMPASKYKKNNAYSYVKDVNTIDTDLFLSEGAGLPDNTCITTYDGNIYYNSYEDFIFNTFNKNYLLFYKYNKDNFNNICINRFDGHNYTELNIDTDFIESSRFPARYQGNGFGSGGCGYKFNVDKAGYEDCWISTYALIRFSSKVEKDNFSRWWYFAGKGRSLSSKTAVGIGLQMAGDLCRYAIPQIDWEKISDHPLWIEGKLDEAVLDIMGLKWNSKMDGVELK